jgi:hypothetical protein
MVVAQVLATAAHVAHPGQRRARTVACRPREALARRALPEHARAVQQRLDAEVGDPPGRQQERPRVEPRSALVVAALQRVAHLLRDQRRQAAQVKPRRAREPDLGRARHKVGGRRVGNVAAQAREVRVVGVAEPVAAHRRKAAARQPAAALL